jgi:hypothetical protein
VKHACAVVDQVTPGVTLLLLRQHHALHADSTVLRFLQQTLDCACHPCVHAICKAALKQNSDTASCSCCELL